MFSINASNICHDDHKPPFQQKPVSVAGMPVQQGPFCEGRFMEDLPHFRPEVAMSWRDVFSQCVGIVEPVESALATAHRQLLALLERLPDTVPGNADLQGQIDRLQIAVGACVMGRYSAGDHGLVLEKLINITVAGRRIERELTEEYLHHWQPAHARRARPFARLAEPHAAPPQVRPAGSDVAQALL